MKRLSIIMMCFALFSLTSCSMLGGASASSSSDTSAAKNTGRNTATALVGLYGSYKTNNTISLTNANDIANALILAKGYTSYRSNQADPAFKKAFAAGMVAAGAGIITNANVDNVLNTMVGLTGLNVNAANISNSVNTASSIVQLLKTLN